VVNEQRQSFNVNAIDVGVSERGGGTIRERERCEAQTPARLTGRGLDAAGVPRGG
jgi:hypothetical protein